MRRISSRMTFFHKRIFPLIALVFLLFFFFIPLRAVLAGGRAPPLPFLVVPIIIFVVGFFSLKNLVFDLADEVWDVGDALIVRNAGREERIALSEVMNVSYAAFMNPQRVTLTLRGSGSARREISFCPPVQFMPFAKSPIILDLIERIDSARRR
jgi:hypothetical protein